jgi:hypothetical protein
VKKARELYMFDHIIRQFLKSLRALEIYVNNTEHLSKINTVTFDDSNYHSEFLDMIMATVLYAKEFGIEISKSFSGAKTKFGDDPNLLKLLDNMEEFITSIESDESFNEKRLSYLPKKVKEFYNLLVSQDRQIEILFNGSLMLLITYLENLISKVFRHDFSTHPDKLKSKEKSITYGELFKYENFSEVKDHLVDEEISKMMYKSFDEWVDYFKTNMKLNLEYINQNLDSINEIIKRRNIYVHNDGIVNSIYLNSLNSKTELKKGDRLLIDEDYLIEAIHKIELVGVSLTIEIWLKDSGRDTEKINEINELIFDEYLVQERWEEAKCLYSICLQNKKLNIADTLLFKLNRWVCLKYIGRYNEVCTEIEKEDFSASSPKYNLAVLALQDNYDEFFKLFDKQQEISEETLHYWPLFKSVRESSIYNERYPSSSDVSEITQELIEI